MSCLRWCGGICGDGSRSALRRLLTSEEFRKHIEILDEVPLFKRLPRSQYPLLAQVMRAKSWKNGQTVLESGVDSTEFFIIARGSAEARVVEDDMIASEPLGVGDYFGEKLLESGYGAASPVEIVATLNLVTLSMTAQEFEDAGLRTHLHFPRRRAIGDMTRGQAPPLLRSATYGATNSMEPAIPGTPRQPSFGRHGSMSNPMKSHAERDFIAKAVRANSNLRSLLDLKDEVVDGIVDIAAREKVSKDQRLVKRGQYSKAFYIVESGSFELRLDDEEEKEDVLRRRASTGKIETMVSEMRKRLQRKDDFLATLTDTGRQKTGRFESDGSRTVNVASLRASTPTVHSALDGDGSSRLQGFGEKTQKKKTLRNSYAGTIPPEALPAGEKKKKYLSCANWQDLSMTTRSILEERGDALAAFVKGESFGEVSLLYNAPQIATAVAMSDSSVWCVSQAAFRRIIINEKNRKLDQIASYLDKVDVLQGLLSHEKQEIAKNFLTLSFNKGDYIVRQNEELLFWYILIQGECTMSRLADGVHEEVLATLRIPQYFGERALLRREPSDFSVQVTSAKGAKCLVLDEQTFEDLIDSDDPAFRRALEDDWRTFAKYKDKAAHANHMAIGMVGKMKEAAALHRMDELVRRRSSRFSVASKSSSREVVLDPEMLSKRTLQRIGVLGAGAFGLVTLERDPITEELYALKTLSKAHIVKCQSQQCVIDEREILSMVDSPFLVRMHATWKDANYIYFVFEPALGGELHTLLHKNPAFRQLEVSLFALACIVQAILHLHERQIIFRDLKPENILLNKDGYSKLCDFGFAKFVTHRTFSICGTPDYIAPEVLAQEGYDRMVDWWALGVLVFELLCFRTPFEDTEEEDVVLGVFTNIRKGVKEVDFSDMENRSKEGTDLVRRLLHSNPTSRLGFHRGQQVLQHSFFSPMDWQKLCSEELPAPYKPQLKSDDDISAFLHGKDEEDEQVPEFEPYQDDGSNWDAVFNA